ncbi:HlyD family secretion protein [Sinomicrobium weinanense]|uniref:Biotin/lipoyl-binding protein n=1 Tax=Sinomicrobium weinanense TaxID=2842200 RepID=A0A926JR79_9FLAO|nr:biotin/lipoyl-binding protein [Sinomicrobium weinanense]MBC9796007.1 biotin/lipoyl-binding protein [Sinomicrobium weinanense]MBU3123174.1 biotin/lipoyl-binding protein [Sinomicrobium weinanense]
MKRIIALCAILAWTGCKRPYDNVIQGRTERESLAVVAKIPGKIVKVFVAEGDMVKKGDTLAILDIPEVDAKKNQALGALTSAKAQYEMAVKGATRGQLEQLRAKHDALKEQYEFAEKSVTRLGNMLKDSLVPQQTYDEAYTKYQGARSQYIAVQAELNEARTGARQEQQTMALGQQERAEGALEEVDTAYKERYIIAPQDMSIETVSLNEGELALPGYALFSGYLARSTYFRFTLPESRLSDVKKGQELVLQVAYNKQEIKGQVSVIKKLGSYANIATAYPDYEMQESLYEIRVLPLGEQEAEDIITQTTVTTTF